MNSLILNRESFEMPADGWYQIAPVGEFPHAAAGVVQVVDRAACEAMVNAFRADAQKPNFAGLLIDFDHFSLDEKLKSEAAGWVVDLENRESGLWGKIRWSDVGEDCVKGGRYRFISPVWAKADCVDLENGRLRPVRLLNAAVTNDPNIKGMVPLSNRRGENGERIDTVDLVDGVERGKQKAVVANATGSPAPRFMWVLGDGDRHCPSCAGLAGQVHTMTDWDAAGLRPGSGNLFCQGHCKCSLVETEEPEGGSLDGLRVKEEVVNRDVVENAWSDSARAAALKARRANLAREAAKLERMRKEQKAAERRGDYVAPGATRKKANEAAMRLRRRVRASYAGAYRNREIEMECGQVLDNNWSDAARLASIAVRKAKATARRALGRDGKPELPVEPRDPVGGGRREEDARRFLPVDDPGIPRDPRAEDDVVRVLPVDDPEQDRQYALQEIEGYQDEARAAFRERYGYPPEDPDEIAEAEKLAGVPEEYRTRGEMSTEELAEELAARGSDDRLGSGDGDPEFQRLERESMDEARDELLRGQDEAEAVHGIAEGLIEREAAGESLSEGEKDFLKKYREIIGDLSDVRAAAVGNRAGGAVMDEAREAVRGEKTETRKQKAEMGLNNGERI